MVIDLNECSKIMDDFGGIQGGGNEFIQNRLGVKRGGIYRGWIILYSIRSHARYLGVPGNFHGSVKIKKLLSSFNVKPICRCAVGQ